MKKGVRALFDRRFFIRAQMKAVVLRRGKLHGLLDVWRFKLPFRPS